MTIDFQEFVTQSMIDLKIKQESFINDFSINEFNSWYYDQPSGVFTFSTESTMLFFQFQIIGSFSLKTKTWLWSWANNNTYPNVKLDALRVKNFGHSNRYQKLIEESWPAEEVDGWEMLAVANVVLQPLGVYRIPSDDLFMFIVFTEHISKAEADERKRLSKQLISCDCHGLGRPSFVCSHLNKFHNNGFHESFETWQGMKLENDDDFQAWCNDCEEVRLKCDGWTEEAMKFANIKVVCEACYFEMKNTVNRGSLP